MLFMTSLLNLSVFGDDIVDTCIYESLDKQSFRPSVLSVLNSQYEENYEKRIAEQKELRRQFTAHKEQCRRRDAVPKRQQLEKKLAEKGDKLTTTLRTNFKTGLT